MSTIDPAVERRRQALERMQRPSRPGAGLWILVLIYWGLWALFAYSLADTLRYPIAEAYLPPSLYPDNVAPAWFFGVFVGSFGGFIAGFLLSYVLKELYGLAASTWGQFASTLLACAAGFWRGAGDSWVAPPRVGSFADAPGAPAPDWDAVAWLGWSAQYWLPASLALAALCCAGLAWRAHRRHAARAERIRRLLAEGRRADAAITEVHDTGVEIYHELRLRFVAKFTDHAGTERWVTKVGLFDPVQVPRVGDAAVVWFYPDRAGDEDQILVGFANGDEPVA
ncbi:hypothetical protein [Lysobacter sp. Hz 25]|uniref:hypothetical protein n=1 Tax=Lysobacter sp. Hz 25 TaxID=3383698 RepID=UPI0038D3FF3D